jgi:hypothetical protein
MSTYTCRQCGEKHEGPPLSYGAEAPSAYYGVPEEERENRCQLSSDQCIIDNESFFILGNIYLRILDKEETFNWTVWVSLSEENFNRASELWETQGRESEPAYFGWLSTDLQCYPSTLSLKTNVCTQKIGERPIIELQDHMHPLVKEQKDGITWERVEEIASLILHDENS